MSVKSAESFMGMPIVYVNDGIDRGDVLVCDPMDMRILLGIGMPGSPGHQGPQGPIGTLGIADSNTAVVSGHPYPQVHPSAVKQGKEKFIPSRVSKHRGGWQKPKRR